MAEWLIERGIGETRAALIEDGAIVEARIMLDDVLPAGSVLVGRRQSWGEMPIAVAGEQQFMLIGDDAAAVPEGALIHMEIIREDKIGREKWKRPVARVTDKPVQTSPALIGRQLQCPAPHDELEEAGWSDLLEEARAATVSFAGGSLTVALTAAMTLIDIDGRLPPAKLAIAGARAAGQTIRRHGVGGSIGIDLPTTPGKEIRQAAAHEVDKILPHPFQRTSVNGFGFLQIVRDRPHASLFELAADRPAFEARVLLRGVAKQIGAITLVAHPVVTSFLAERPDWIEGLARQVGGAVTLRSDPSLAMSAGHAEPA